MDANDEGTILHVLETLRNACSQNTTVLKPAENILKAWETQSGFYNILSTIFLNHAIEVNVRWLAVLLFKNGIDRYWRRNAPNAIAEEEKMVTKQRLIMRFDEPTNQIATQLAVLIAKVARIDCPRNWNELIPTLLQAVRNHDDTMQSRALLTLHHVTKTLASKCLAADRKLFTQMTSEILGYIVELWRGHLSAFFQAATQYDDYGMKTSIDRVILASKVIRKQVIYGFKDIRSSEVAIAFISSLYSKLPEILACRHTLWGNHAVLAKCEALILLLTKIMLELLEHHAVAFIQFISATLHFVLSFTFHESTGGLRFEKFTVNCFNLMKGIVYCDQYRPSKDSTSAVAGEARQIIDGFFTDSLLTEMCRRLVTHYFLLKCDDLLNWERDPEDYAQDEIGDNYKFSLRPCTEVLFLALFKTYRQCMASVLIDLVASSQAPCDPDNMPAMLAKEAVYNAVGLAAYELYDDIDFDSWFTSQLLPELSIQHNNYRIIRRRVIWLLGQWVGVKFSASLRPALYQAIIPLLSPTEDTVVRLEAAHTLKAVDDFEFQTDIFLPYLNSLFALLFHLLTNVSECDSKMAVLHVISFVIERVGGHIVPYAPTLIQYLPILWDDAQEHNMLRCAIVCSLIQLVQGLESSCTSMFDFIIPVIQMSTNVIESPHVYLLEDGIGLWLTTLHHTPTMPLQLLSLFANMPSLMELGSEHLGACLRITEAYIMLGGEDFLKKYSDILASSLTSLITDVKFEGLALIIKVVECVLTMFPDEGLHMFHSLLINIFMSTLQKEHDYPLILPAYLSVFARVIISNPQTFLVFLESVALQLQRDTPDLLASFLDSLFDHIDIVIEPERRKLLALAVVSLVSLNISVVLERFALLVNLCVEVLHDINQPHPDSNVHIDSLMVQFDACEDTHTDTNADMNTDQLTQHDRRLRLLRHRDPVYTIELREFVRHKFTECQRDVGERVFGQLMANTDSQIVQQLERLLT